MDLKKVVDDWAQAGAAEHSHKDSERIAKLHRASATGGRLGI